MNLFKFHKKYQCCFSAGDSPKAHSSAVGYVHSNLFSFLAQKFQRRAGEHTRTKCWWKMHICNEDRCQNFLCMHLAFNSSFQKLATPVPFQQESFCWDCLWTQQMNLVIITSPTLLLWEHTVAGEATALGQSLIRLFVPGPSFSPLHTPQWPGCWSAEVWLLGAPHAFH